MLVGRVAMGMVADQQTGDWPYSVQVRDNDGNLHWTLTQLDDERGWGGDLELEHVDTGRTYTLNVDSGKVVVGREECALTDLGAYSFVGSEIEFCPFCGADANVPEDSTGSAECSRCEKQFWVEL